MKEGNRPSISWLQSLEEQNLSIPVINPFLIKADYRPVVEDELLKSIGEINEQNLLILLSLTVPTDITKMSVNLKAPFVINSDTRKGCQTIVENQDYEVKYNVYNFIRMLNEEKGEK